VTRASLRRSLRHTSAARAIRSAVRPLAIAAKVFIEHGMTTMPQVRNDPEEIDAARLEGSWFTSARASKSARPVW
jgi:hypothetical protein